MQDININNPIKFPDYKYVKIEIKTYFIGFKLLHNFESLFSC